MSLSYGKDSLACLGAIEKLGWPLDRIIHAEIWATDTIQADLPPMVEFKEKADRIIKERYGIEVEHYYAMKDSQKLTYERMFYTIPTRRKPERERERIVAAARHDPRFPNAKDAVVQQPSQTECLTVSLLQSGHGARNSSTERIYGFPMRRGNWCTSLKTSLFK